MTHARVIRAVLASALIAAATACGGTDSGTADAAVPRRTAYPRITTLDTVYTRAEGIPLHFLTPAGATVEPGRDSIASLWWNVVYPTYGATLYITFTPVTPATAPAVVDNRTERIALNAGPGTTATMQLESASGSFGGSIYRSPSSPATPLQFLAVDTAMSWVVSGALFFHRAGATGATDSLAPVVDAVERDVTHALQHLDYAGRH